MTPAHELADEIVMTMINTVMQWGGKVPDGKLQLLSKQIAASIQQVADDQQQSDAQAFGDMPILGILDGTPPHEGCLNSYGETCDVTITPLFPTTNGNN